MLRRSLAVSITLLVLSLSHFAYAGGVTIITHGFNGDMAWVNDAGAKLLNRIATEYYNEVNDGNYGVALYLMTLNKTTGVSIDCKNGVEFGSVENGTGHAVIKIDWTDYAGDFTFWNNPTEGASTGEVANWIVGNLRTWANTQLNFISSPIHLIGHSRGGSLVGAMAIDLAEFGYWVDQVTFLDPHPTENRWNEDDWGEEEGMVVWGNVIFADNYYRTDLQVDIPNGEEVVGAYQIRLKNSYFDEPGLLGVGNSYGSEHSDVHAWYRGTIPSWSPPIYIESNDFHITSEWYVADAYQDSVARPRDTIGYAFSLTANGGNNRPYEGLHSGINGSGQARSFFPTTSTPINNVGYLTLGSTSVTAGNTIVANYRYQSWTSDFGVEFYLDTNRNPYDGYLDTRRLGEYANLGVSNGIEGVSNPATLAIPSDIAPGKYYIFIMSIGSNGPRYFYAHRQLTVLSRPAPEGFNECRFAYIPNHDDDSVSVIDILANAVVDTVSVGDRPVGVSVSPLGDRVYIANLGDNTVSVIDSSTMTVVGTVTVGEVPVNLAVSPSGTHVYVTNGGIDSYTVSVIDTVTKTVVDTITVGRSPCGIAFSPSDDLVYIAHLNDNILSVIDTSTNAIIDTIPLEKSGAVNVLFNPLGTRVYVKIDSGFLLVIDTSINAVIDTIPITNSTTINHNLSTGMDINPAGTHIYVSYAKDNTISVIETSTNTIIETISLSSEPGGLNLSSSGRYIYLTDKENNSVSVIDTMTNTIIETIPVGTMQLIFGNFINTNGCAIVEVPYILGLSQVIAESILSSFNLAVGTIKSAYSDTVEAGNVISQFPIDGTSVYFESTVDIIVSLGMLDEDNDGLPDGFEQQIINADLNDEIISIEDVNPKDDFDKDGYCNLREMFSGSDAVNPLSIPNCIGDSSNDNDIDGIDISNIANLYGTVDCTTEGGCHCDLDNDGDIDDIDLLFMSEDFGRIDCQ